VHKSRSENLLLSSIPDEQRQHLFASCELIELESSQVLFKRGSVIDHVYFPTTAVISLVMPVDEHSQLEVGLIGNEGMLGINVMLGVEDAPFGAVVQRGGTTLRMFAPLFVSELEQNSPLRTKLMCYLFVLMSQLIQTAGCHRFHVVEKRLARLLLMIKDRAHSPEFHITQELLSQMLGVRRVGVTQAAQALQERGLIRYSRGNVIINNVRGLEGASCSCYQADKDVYARILGPY
jgi:CRP-like cAMP-binding protein